MYGTFGTGSSAVGWPASCIVAGGTLIPRGAALTPFLIRDITSDANGRIYVVGFSDDTPARQAQLMVF